MADIYTRRAILKRGAGAGLLLLGGGSFMAACGAPSGSSGPETTLDRIKRTGVAKVAFGNERPFAYQDASGNLTGFETDLIREILKEKGVQKLEGVLVDFSAMIPTLQAKRADIIGAGIWITPKRCGQILFSNPDYLTGEAFVVKKGNPKNLHSFADVARDRSAKVVLIVGSAEISYADINGISKAQQVVVPDYQTGFSTLQAGQVDALIELTVSARVIFKTVNDPNLEFVYLTEQPKDQNGKPIVSYGAMGFRTEDADLRDFYSAGLAKLRASGRQLEIMARYGLTEQDLAPADLISDQLCKA